MSPASSPAAADSPFTPATARSPRVRPAEIDPKSPREGGYRVPRCVADLAAARPIHLAIVDGIESMTSSEGPGRFSKYVKPHLLIAGTQRRLRRRRRRSRHGLRPHRRPRRHPLRKLRQHPPPRRRTRRRHPRPQALRSHRRPHPRSRPRLPQGLRPPRLHPAPPSETYRGRLYGVFASYSAVFAFNVSASGCLPCSLASAIAFRAVSTASANRPASA